MPAIQSDRPEDTAAAREQGLTADDFQEDAADAPQPARATARRCLSSEDILAAADRPYLENWVATPEWGGPGAGVYVLTPSGEDRERYERITKIRRKRQGRKTVEIKEMNFDELRERLVIDFACNGDGKPLFPCTTREERREVIRRLKRKAAAPIGRIGNLACELMGWTADDIENLTGNSETDPSS